MKKFFLADFTLGLLLTLVFLVLFLVKFSPIETLELKTYDWRMNLRSRTQTVPAQIVIVAIDDESIQNIGRWPWPRGIIANLISKISFCNPKVIGLDILFSEAETNPGLVELAAIQELLQKNQKKISPPIFKSLSEQLDGAISRLDNDSQLEVSLRECKNLVLPCYSLMDSQVEIPLEYQVLLSSFALVREISSIGEKFFPLESLGLILPLERFLVNARYLGLVNLYPDGDGILRREVPVIKYGESFYPSFSLAVAGAWLGISQNEIRLKSDGKVLLGKISVPLDEDGSFKIDYFGGYKSFKYVSAFDLLGEKIARPETIFAGKIVLVGVTASGIGTLSATPVARALPGVEIVANVIGDVIQGQFIHRDLKTFYYELGILLLVGVFLIFGLGNFRAGSGALISAILFVVILLSGVISFLKSGLWLKISYSLLLLISGYIVIISKRFFITERRKELVEADSVETNKMLGLSFQSQGLLDMAFEKFRKCPIDESMKELLYNLALDFERKRQFNKAVAVYEHIMTVDKNYKGIAERVKQLKVVGETMIFGAPGLKKTAEGTVLMEGIVQPPTLGRYEVLKELGRGAMGIVYLGKDPKINRLVAIKTVRFEDEVDEEQKKAIKQRFFREAESAGKLNHPNIITIYDAGEDQDVSYIAMELLDGEDLKKFTDRKNLLPIRKVLELVITVSEALDFAHQQGIVHRDIKPANIMIQKDGTVKITDFGIARITASSTTQTGTVLGTPSYMSPEQIAGKKVDGRSDIFSLGVVLYELLTGEKPFTGDSIATLLYQITNENPRSPKEINPAIPESVVKVIERALAKDVNLRYQRAKEMADDLRRCLAEIPE